MGEVRSVWDTERAVVFSGDGEPKSPQEMLRRLAEFDSEVGIESDRFSRFGTVEKLERRFAEMLGKDAAMFVPTGTLANHLAIRGHCGPNPRAVVQEQCHLYNDTGDCVSRLSGINLIPLARNRPYFTLDELKEAFDQTESSRVSNPIGAVMIESPVLRQRGRIVPFDVIREITDFCRERGVPAHMDAARMYMMSSATGVPPEDYAACFDTVYVSLHKYFGAPFGAILAGSAEFTAELYHERRMFGGGLSSVWLAAALALKGADGFEERFSAAMAQAAELFERLNTIPGIRIGRFEHGSNVFPVDLAPDVDVDRFVSDLRDRGVFISPGEEGASQFHVWINTTILRQTNDELFEGFKLSLEESFVGVQEQREA